MDEPTLPEDATIHDRIMAKLQPKVEEEPTSPEEIEDSTDTQDIEDAEVEDVVEEEVTAEEPAEETAEDDTTDESTITLDDLATYAGLESDRFDVSDDGKVLFKAKVDGKEELVPLKDALDSYQIRSHLNNENKEVVELKKQLKQQLEDTQSQVEAKNSEAEALIAAVYNDYMEQYSSVDWNELKQDDPQEYLIRKQEFEERKARLADSYQKILDQKPKADPQQLEAQVYEARRNFVDLVPEWKANNDLAEREWKEMIQYSVSEGFGENDVALTTDHKLLNMVRKSMLYDKIMSESTKVTKQVRKAPKIVKSGAPKVKVSPQDVENKKLLANVKANKPGSIAEYLLKTGKV